jgi:RNA recognition motif-containing protein
VRRIVSLEVVSSSRTLYVGGLPPETDSDALRTMFSEFGELSAARVVMRSTTGRCRGFGYVTFVTTRAAIVAKLALDGRLMDGGRLRVAEAT